MKTIATDRGPITGAARDAKSQCGRRRSGNEEGEGGTLGRREEEEGVGKGNEEEEEEGEWEKDGQRVAE